MDSVFHGDGWADTASEGFHRALEAFVTAETWIVDGNYTSQGARQLV